MATPTQQQPFQGPPAYATQPAPGPAVPPGPFPTERTASSQAAYGAPPPSATAPPTFDKYCVIHVATTCDEHGVYVTKDSAEVIEIGWVVVDAKDPNLPEVRVCAPWETTSGDVTHSRHPPEIQK